MINRLAIDTAFPVCSVALQVNSDEVISELGSKENSHSEELPVLVEKVISKSGLKIADLDEIILGAGPGSFTGLRIGYAFVKGLAHALKIPVRTYSSLQAACLLSTGKVLAISDARREEVFAAICNLDLVFEVVLQDQILSQVELPKLVEKYDIDHVINISGIKLPFASKQPTGVSIGLLKLALLSKQVSEYDLKLISELKPNYIRTVAAKTLAERGL